MSDLAFVCVVALVCVVGVVAICFGRKLTGKMNMEGAEIKMGEKSDLS